MSKEFKAGDKVRALDNSLYNHFVKGDIYEVFNTYEDRGDLRVTVVADSNGNKNGWLADNFELVESFDDLIDVAIQAVKDGLLEINKLDKDFITAKLPGNPDFFFLTSYRNKPQNFEKDILSINSLYTETFVIESEYDVARIKYGDKCRERHDCIK